MGTPLHLRLVEMLHERRKQAGLTQAKLAASMTRSQSYIADLENGQRRVDVVEYVALAEALDFDPGSVLNELIADKSNGEG